VLGKTRCFLTFFQRVRGKKTFCPVKILTLLFIFLSPKNIEREKKEGRERDGERLGGRDKIKDGKIRDASTAK
jgi:hypothetical protein